MKKISLIILTLLFTQWLFASEFRIRNFGPQVIKITLFGANNTKLYAHSNLPFGESPPIEIKKSLISASWRDTSDNKQYRTEFPQKRLKAINIGNNGMYSIVLADDSTLQGQAIEVP